VFNRSQSVLVARPGSLTGHRDIYVEDGDLDRAREILREAESVSDEELADESGAAVQQTQLAQDEPIDVPVPKRSAWKRVLGRRKGQRDN
jgi:hypothetical protein